MAAELRLNRALATAQTFPPQWDKGYAAYLADRRERGVPEEGLPTYTLLPLAAQLEAIKAMAS